MGIETETRQYAASYESERKEVLKAIADDKEILAKKHGDEDSELLAARIRRNEEKLKMLDRKYNIGGNLEENPEIRALKNAVADDLDFLDGIGKDKTKTAEQNQLAMQMLKGRLKRNTDRLRKLTEPKIAEEERKVA